MQIGGIFRIASMPSICAIGLLARYQPIFIQDYDLPGGHFYRVQVGWRRVTRAWRNVWPSSCSRATNFRLSPFGWINPPAAE